MKSRVSLLELPATATVSSSYAVAYLFVGIALILLITTTLNKGLDYFRQKQNNDQKFVRNPLMRSTWEAFKTKQTLHKHDESISLVHDERQDDCFFKP